MTRLTQRFPVDLKAYVFSTQLLHSDLAQIEAEHAIELGHLGNSTQDIDETYYPQFDEDVRREAAEMSRHYELFYSLEKSIRRLIDQTIREAVNGSWWDSGRVPKTIHE